MDLTSLFVSPQGSDLRKILLTRYFGTQKLLSKTELGSGNCSSVKPSSGGTETPNKPNRHCISGCSKHRFILISPGGSPMLDHDKPASSLVEIQCLLDNVGASELVIDLIVNTKNDRVFEESILLGIALLQGGNTQIQVSSSSHCIPVHAHTLPGSF